jgi:hypothetical protein
VQNLSKEPMTHSLHQDQATASPGAGIVIALSAVASIAAVALDSGPSGHDVQSILQGMVQIQHSHLMVHIVAMMCIGGLMFGHTVLARRLDLRRSPVLAGLIAYGFGSMLMLVATVIDGLISTDTAAFFVTRSPEAMRTGYWIIQAMSSVALVDIARVAWVFQSVAAVALGAAMLSGPVRSRWLGIAGTASGALPAIAVFAYGSAMTEMVVVGILLVQAVWNFIAAAYLIRRPAGAASGHATLAAVYQ